MRQDLLLPLHYWDNISQRHARVSGDTCEILWCRPQVLTHRNRMQGLIFVPSCIVACSKTIAPWSLFCRPSFRTSSLLQRYSVVIENHVSIWTAFECWVTSIAPRLSHQGFFRIAYPYRHCFRYILALFGLPACIWRDLLQAEYRWLKLHAPKVVCQFNWCSRLRSPPAWNQKNPLYQASQIQEIFKFHHRALMTKNLRDTYSDITKYDRS